MRWSKVEFRGNRESELVETQGTEVNRIGQIMVDDRVYNFFSLLPIGFFRTAFFKKFFPKAKT